MDKEDLRNVYNDLKAAREKVAGDNIQEPEIILAALKPAITGLINLHKKLCGVHDYRNIGWVHVFISKVTMAKGLIENIKEYRDRLEPDRILCDVLNEMLKELN